MDGYSSCNSSRKIRLKHRTSVYPALQKMPAPHLIPVKKMPHNDEKTLQHKFFKEILTQMQNAEEVHLTGTGTSQEQLMRYKKETPQFKNTITTDTSNKMSDENLAEYIEAKFN